MNTVGERILEIKNQFFGSGYGSNVKFAKAINVEPNVVSNWFLRGDGIGVAVMQQVLAFDKSIDANWLITGDGQMLKEASSSPPANEKEAVYKEMLDLERADKERLRIEHKNELEVLRIEHKNEIEALRRDKDDEIRNLIVHEAELEQRLSLFTSEKPTAPRKGNVAGAVGLKKTGTDEE